MISFVKRLAFFALATSTFGSAALADGPFIMAARQKVNNREGLVVYDQPNGVQVGSLQFGEEVRVAGKQVEGDPGVHATALQVGKVVWIKIKKPVKGMVMLNEGAGPFYLIPTDGSAAGPQ